MNPRQVLFSLLILFLPVLVGFGPSPTLVESDDSRIPIGSGQLQALAEARPPLLRGQAALIMDINTERVVYQHNGNGKLAAREHHQGDVGYRSLGTRRPK